ncbi:MAG TPA: hypothetical protein EYG38_08620 [Verrucomicrobia bacterium]|nr:hypothetical protein [Verrucomicrobiota bacterium]
MTRQPASLETLNVTPLGNLAHSFGWILLATALSEVDLTVAIIPQDIQSSSQRRVDFGYNPGIIIGSTDANGRAYFGYGQTSYDNGDPEISLTGDTDTDYIIEGSKDLKNGSPFTTTTIWAAPISDLQPEGVPHRFFRVRAGN